MTFRVCALALCVSAAVSAMAASGCKTTGTDAAPTTFEAFDGAAYPSTRPHAKVPSGPVALVGSSGNDVLRWVDLTAGNVFFTAPAGRDPVDVDGPRVVGGDGDGGAAYALLTYPNATVASGPHASRALSPRAAFFQRLALDDLRIVGEVRIGALAGEAALSDDGARLVGTRFDTRPLDAGADAGIDPVSPLFDVATATLLEADPPSPVERASCIAPNGVALSHPHGATAFVACYGEDALLVLDLDGASKSTRVPLGGGVTPPVIGPSLAALSPDNATLAVATDLASDVRFFDVAKGAFVDGRVTKLSGHPQRMEWSGAKLAVPTADADAVIVLDGATGAVLASRTFDPTCLHPRQAAWGDGALYVVCEGDATHDGAIQVLDPGTLGTRRAIVLSARPTSFTLARPR